MTIETESPRLEYVGNGSTTDFAIAFKFIDDADILLYVNEVEITTGFTIAGGSGSTGTLTFDVAPILGDLVVIINSPAYTQETDWVDGDPLTAASLETAFDKLTILAQRVYDLIGRSFKFGDGIVGGTTTIGDSPVDRAGKALIFDSNGDLVTSTESFESGSAYAASASASAVSASNSAAAAAMSAAEISNLDHTGDWATSTSYKKNNVVYVVASGQSYMCLMDHISGADFATDLGSGYWNLVAKDGDLDSVTGVVAIANGGTGQTTASGAINAILPAQGGQSGKFLSTNGTIASWASGGSGVGDVYGPASSTNNAIVLFDGTTGKTIKDSSKLLPSGTLVDHITTQTLFNKTISNGSSFFGNTINPPYGGTGLSGYQTGDTIYATSSSTLGRLAIGTTGQALKVGVSGIPEWGTISGGSGAGFTDITDYGAVADFVGGPGSTKVSGTDQSTAFDSALATNEPLYLPAGDYWVASTTTRNNLQFRSWSGPGVVWGNTNVGYTKLGKTWVVGTNRSHEVGSVGGLHIGGEDGGYGMRQWMGHHNWMQFQPMRYGAPSQVQLYPSTASCVGHPVAPNAIVADYGTFDTSEMFVGDYIGWNGGLYVLESVSASSVTVTKAFVGGSPGWATNTSLQKPAFKAYETATGTCNTSGTTLTFVSGEQFPYGTSSDHQYVFVNGTKYTVTQGPEVVGANTLTLGSSPGTLTGATFKYYRQYAPWSYVTLMRLQGIAGGRESNAVMSINTRNEFLIGGTGTDYNLVPNMRIESPRTRIGGGELYPFNGTTDQYGIEVIAPMDDLSYGAHYVRIGGYNGREALKVVTWNSYTDHFTIYGSVSSIQTGPVLAAEGSSATLDMFFKTKGLGRVGFYSSLGSNEYFSVINAGMINRCEIASSVSSYAPTLRARGSDANVDLGFDTQGSGSFTFTSHGFANKEFGIYGIGSTSNVAAAGSVTGTPGFVSEGAASNIDMKLLPKGNGMLWLGGAFASTTDTAITGYLPFRDASGTIRYIACIG